MKSLSSTINLMLRAYSVLYACLLVPQIKADPDFGDGCIGKYPIGLEEEDKVFNKVVSKKRLFSPLICTGCEEVPDSIALKNTVQTVVINFHYSDVSKIPQIENGPLKGKGVYRFEHIYFEWKSIVPYEFMFNDIEFAVELHVVFYNTKYPKYEIAVEQNEGIAILAIGYRVRQTPRRQPMQEIAYALQNIVKPYTNVSLDQTKLFNLYHVLPEDFTFYSTYIGTMISEKFTTTTCRANVIWIDFEENHKITPDQVEKFDSLEGAIPWIHLLYNVEYYDGPRSIIYNSVDSGQTRLFDCTASGFLSGFIALIVVLNVVNYQ